MRAPQWILVATAAWFLAGCGGVREDRTIRLSPDGESAGFQHGREGVFVREGGQLAKICDVDDDTLAVSTPLWSPDGARLIFTTAKAAPTTDDTKIEGGDEAAASQLPLIPDWNADPAGRVVYPGDVVYTCWLRERHGDDDAEPPVALFEAACDHVGYVAANLTVRWSADGRHVLYVDRLADGSHTVFEFNLAAGTSRRALPQAGLAVIFDAAPGGQYLACVVAKATPGSTSGIWIGDGDADGWWHVPDTRLLADWSNTSWIERLRATRPAWQADGQRFAYTTQRRDEETRQALWQLHAAAPAAREVELLAVSPDRLGEVHWSPDGMRLGLLRGDDPKSLHTLLVTGKQADGNSEQTLSPPINERPVRQFAGWNSQGDRLAYVVPEANNEAAGDSWATLLSPVPDARDVVLVARGDGSDPGREVFGDMRVTFPHWSPQDDRLSFWATFSPTHQSVFTLLLGLGLRRVDPAAVLDVKSGDLTWMPIDARERIQVGHYCVLQGRYEDALRWYDEAESLRAAADPPSDGRTGGPSSLLPEDSLLFRYICLEKLGRAEEAEAVLQRLRELAISEVPQSDQRVPAVETRPNDAALQKLIAQLFGPESLLPHLLWDLYAAEVYLSLDLPDDGIAFLRRALREGRSDRDRLGAGIALAQLYLLEQRFDEYAELMTADVAPLLITLWRPVGEVPSPDSADAATAAAQLLWFGGLTLAPMYADAFLAEVSLAVLAEIAPRWESLREDAGDDTARLAIDLFLQASYARLGPEDLRATAARRVAENPARGKVAALMPPMSDTQRAVEALRGALSLNSQAGEAR